MSLKWITFIGCVAAICLTTFLVGNWRDDEKKTVVIKRQLDGLQLEFIQNSHTASQAMAMNASGSIIGVKENDADFRQLAFYFGKDECHVMPVPKGYTMVEASAISDTELIVGRTAKAVGSEGSLRAVLWSPAKANIQLLPPPQGDAQCDATDISADGKRITGYATGLHRLRPVVWQWNESQASWQVELLPTEHSFNPYLMSSQLIISPDGNIIVGCCTEKFLEDGTVDSSLYEWRQVDGRWTRRLVTEQQLYVKAINNKGEIAGSVSGVSARRPCMVTSSGEVKLLKLLDGDVSGEARDINEASTIVGWSDDPPGPDGGPTPCMWSADGTVTPVRLNESGFGMLYAINNKAQMAGASEVITKAASSPNANDEEAAMLAVIASKK